MPNSFVACDLQKRMQICSARAFTGLLEVNIKSDAWFIYFVSGRVVWLKSNRHPLRQWERQLSIHNPAFYCHISQPASSSYKSWNYGALAELVKSGRFSEQILSDMADAAIAENFFDILQLGTQQSHRTGSIPVYRAKTRDICHLPSALTYHDRAWQKAQCDWEEWEKAGLIEISPGWIPVISKMEELRSRTSTQTFETLSKFINGRNSLRDLALKFKQPLPALTKAVLPYVEKGLLRFVDFPNLVEAFDHVFYPTLFVNDLDAIDLLNRDPVEPVQVQERLPVNSVREKPNADRPVLNQHSLAADKTAPKVVYIDDSPIDDRQMSAVVEGLGYQYTSIANPIHALPKLLEIKPDFIFLDLVMPIANGYEVCSQIRRISAFKRTPVVIVTSNDGIGDRVRAKFVGASGFIGKPIQAKKVSRMLKKYLGDVGNRVDAQLANPKGIDFRSAEPPVSLQSNGQLPRHGDLKEDSSLHRAVKVKP